MEENNSLIASLSESEKDFSSSMVSIIPIGGLGEIGMNMMVMETEDDMIIIDSGLMFPEEEMLGIDLVLPDFSYILAKKDKIRGIILTHGHDDHIGALPFLMRNIDAPVFGTRLTLALAKDRLNEYGLVEKVSLNIVKPRDILTLPSFKIEFISVNHSITDGVGLGIETPVGLIVHTGDFKLDQTPVGEAGVDFHKFAEYGDRGTLLMLSDSTNVEKKGFTPSEKEVGEALINIFRTAKKRIIIASFASHFQRIQQVFDISHQFGRKVVLLGMSMVTNVRIASELGYLKIPEELIIPREDICKYGANRLVILSTGSQGEPMSALSLMATEEHKQITIEKGDTVIISARVIPGNERAIARIINLLFKLGADVLYEEIAPIHVSGHPCQEELKIMLNLVRPKYFIPIHGEYRHLVFHAELAEKVGLLKENIFVIEDGQVVEFTKDVAVTRGKIPSGRILVDGKGIGDVGAVVLKDRQHLAQDGIVIVAISIDKNTRELLSGPEIESRGFVYMKESEELIEDAKKIVNQAFSEIEEDIRRDIPAIRSKIRNVVKKFIAQKTDRRPIILSIVLEV